jgi:hypothetical protein
MTQQHPITPPPERVEPSNTHLCQLFDGLEHCFSKESQRDYLRQWIRDWTTDKVNRAAQWGADQELEACCEWLSVPCPSYGRELRNARRPKPPSLKEQALQALAEADLGSTEAEWSQRFDTIRCALEQLPDNN